MGCGPRRVQTGFDEFGGKHVVAWGSIFHVLNGLGDIFKFYGFEQTTVVEEFVRWRGGCVTSRGPERLVRGFWEGPTHCGNVIIEFVSNSFL